MFAVPKPVLESPMFTAFANAGAIDVSDASMSIEITSYVEDRLAGVTVTERIWSGDKINSSYLSRLLSDGAVRLEVQRFFSSRAIRVIFPAFVGSPSTWRVGGYRSAVDRVYATILASVKDVLSAHAIMEIMMPAFANNHVTDSPDRLTAVMNRFTYPLNTNPTVEQLSAEAARQYLERAVVDCVRSWSIKAGETYSVSAVADDLANAFFPIGRALRGMYDYTIVFTDLVKIVRARLDPELDGLLGSIPNTILSHPVVDNVVGNWTFIREALSVVPDGKTSISITSTEYAFDKWAGDALATLKASDRFVFRSRRDALRNIGVMHVSDLDGYRRAAVVYENAKMVPEALSVVATKDAVIDEAVNIDNSTGRIDAHLTTAYGDLCNTFSPARAATALSDILSRVIEVAAPDECGRAPSIGVIKGVVRDVSIEHLATMMADRLLRNPAKPDEIVYCVATSARLQLSSGVNVRGYVYTTDPAEVVLSVGSLAEPGLSEPLPQLLPRAALGSQLFSSAAEDIFIRPASRFTFSQSVGRVVVQGAVKLAELETARADLDAAIVRPSYNSAVFTTARDLFGVARSVVTGVSAVDDPLSRRHLDDVYVQAFVSACRGVSPAFRHLMHSILNRKTLRNVEQKDIRLLTAHLNQIPVKAFADSFATAFFLGVQGIGPGYIKQTGTITVDERKERVLQIDPIFRDLWEDTDLLSHMVAFGSDRRD